MRQFVVLFALALASASANLIPQPGFPEGRIINGNEAQKGEAPYILSMQTTFKSHFCSGVLLSSTTALTAGHCILSYPEGLLVAGAHSRLNEDSVQTRKFDSSQFVVHEEYSGGVGPNDIGLIRLSKEDAFDLNAVARDGSNPVGVVSLPPKTFESTGDGYLYGWGRDNSGSLPTNLQTLKVDIIGYTACQAAMPVTAQVDICNVCTYTAGTTDGACNGDSGGPLVKKTDNEAYLIGIVSWGFTPCASTYYPSVYTNVIHYQEWIEENCNDNE
ncbi:lectizyme [Drosophila subpulchrella]|uniref:lectizyme n=1 Tax=Drosophila subpulchrella TaxID=1486046 RepID=UPI0018A1A02B|nr:lectizyme [Drosophila subpulchrella]